MSSKDNVLKREQDRGYPIGVTQGKADALDLAERAPTMDGTEIIAEEEKVPQWSETASYTVGVAVKDDGQVYTLLSAHTPSHNPGYRPANLRSIYDLRHTKDPQRAKYWMASYGTSGLYKTDECCTYENPNDGLLHVYKNVWDNNEYPPHTLTVESRWEDLGLASDIQI